MPIVSACFSWVLNLFVILLSVSNSEAVLRAGFAGWFWPARCTLCRPLSKGLVAIAKVLLKLTRSRCLKRFQAKPPQWLGNSSAHAAKGRGVTSFRNPPLPESAQVEIAPIPAENSEYPEPSELRYLLADGATGKGLASFLASWVRPSSAFD